MTVINSGDLLFCAQMYIIPCEKHTVNNITFWRCFVGTFCEMHTEWTFCNYYENFLNNVENNAPVIIKKYA